MAFNPKLRPSASIIFETEYTPAPAHKIVPVGALSETKYIAAGVTLSGVKSCSASGGIRFAVILVYATGVRALQ